MSIPKNASGTDTLTPGKTHLDRPLSVQQPSATHLDPLAVTPGACACHWDVPSDQDTIELAIGKTRLVLEILADSLCGIDFSQWTGSASQACQSKVQGVCALINAVDDELQETRRLLQITGDMS